MGLRPRILALLAAICVLIVVASTVSAASRSSARAVRACGLPNAAFCDTFSGPQKNPAGDREGQLNAGVWGVSRELGFNNLGQHQYDAAVRSLQMGGSCPTQTVTVETDIKICHGELDEVVNDNPAITPANAHTQDDSGTVTSLAMYPKQPFDFAGRTGKVVFAVADDSGGMHAAWPEFWITSLPIPDPFVHLSSWQSIPQYGFGLRLGAVCIPYQPNVSGSGDGGCGPHCQNATRTVVTVASAMTVNNYSENDSDTGDQSPQNPATLKVVPDGCVTQPTKPGALNHFKVLVSESRIDVYATNAGTTAPYIHLASIPSANLGFTRGFVWLEDAHYNGNKGVDVGSFQALHTFAWGSVGFDGPILPRDLGFDAPDSLQPVPGYPALINLGWASSTAAPATIKIPRVSGIRKAIGGLLMFNLIAQDTIPATVEYSLNGHAPHAIAWPYPGNVVGSERTIAVHVAMSEVRAGTNRVKIWSPQDTLILSNVDLIMQGAGGLVAPR
jgi:hypothetical protein